MRIIAEEVSVHPEPRAEFFFRGESKNYKSDYDDESFGTAFQSYLDRKGLTKYERDLYQEAMRLNVASFEEDRTMVERIARMQHYGLPTRFCDMSTNVLLSTHFACGGVAHLPLVSAENVNPSRPKGLDYLTYEVKNNRSGFYYEEEGIGSWLREDIQHVWAFKPMMNSRRIRKQGGVFLAFGCGDNKKPLEPTFSPSDYDNPSSPSYGIKQVGYIRIASEAKANIRNQLRYFGMEAESVYPELSNVCEELDRRFQKIKMEE